MPYCSADTYNVKDVTMARNTDSVCFRCITVMVANDCYVSIEPLKASAQPTLLNASCYSFPDNGTYIIYAHDIDENGKAILIPAIVKEYIVDWIIPLPESSSTSQYELLLFPAKYNHYRYSNNNIICIIKFKHFSF